MSSRLPSQNLTESDLVPCSHRLTDEWHLVLDHLMPTDDELIIHLSSCRSSNCFQIKHVLEQISCFRSVCISFERVVSSSLRCARYASFNPHTRSFSHSSFGHSSLYVFDIELNQISRTIVEALKTVLDGLDSVVHFQLSTSVRRVRWSAASRQGMELELNNLLDRRRERLQRFSCDLGFEFTTVLGHANHVRYLAMPTQTSPTLYSSPKTLTPLTWPYLRIADLNVFSPSSTTPGPVAFMSGFNFPSLTEISLHVRGVNLNLAPFLEASCDRVQKLNVQYYNYSRPPALPLMPRLTSLSCDLINLNDLLFWHVPLLKFLTLRGYAERPTMLFFNKRDFAAELDKQLTRLTHRSLLPRLRSITIENLNHADLILGGWKNDDIRTFHKWHTLLRFARITLLGSDGTPIIHSPAPTFVSRLLL